MKHKQSILLSLLLIVVMLSAVTITAYAHPGGTDSNGGHYDRSTGEYHYHHGYPAHDHYDMDGDGDIDCPYAFDDQTAQSSGNNSGAGSNSGDSIKPDTLRGDSNSSNISLVDIISVIFEYLPGAVALWLFISYFLSYILTLIFGEEQGCSIAMFTGSVIALAVYIWVIISKLT